MRRLEMDQNGIGIRNQFLIWFGANIIGFTALGILAVTLPFIIPISSPYITVFLVALPISIAQWLALRYLLNTFILWILTVPIGILLTQLIINVIPSGFWPSSDDESIANLSFVFLIMGLVIGILQWPFLQRKLSKSLLWILGSCAGVAGSFWVIMVTDLINRSGVLAYIVAVAIYSVITGVTFASMLAYNKKREAHPLNTSVSSS
jgi:hypothetical protein